MLVAVCWQAGARASAKDAVQTAQADLQGQLAQIGAQRTALQSQLDDAKQAQVSADCSLVYISRSSLPAIGRDDSLQRCLLGCM